jgi:hypothetical protein
MKRCSMAIGCLFVFLTKAAEADTTNLASCARAAEEGQAARDTKAFRVAREKLLQCAAAECPTAIRSDCLGWLDTVERAMPSAVFFADAGAGRDVTDVRVYIDGVLTAERLDGRSVPVEPGEHRVRFVWQGSQVQERSVLFVEGEKNRKVEAHFSPPSASASSPSPSPPAPLAASGGMSPWFWIASGVALVGAGGFTAFGLAGRADLRDLDRCEPRCASDDVDAARTKYLLADISLGVGIVGLGVATYLFFTGRQPDTRALVSPPAVRFGGL